MHKLLRNFAASTSAAYLFLMASLLIGLPLLTAHYIVDPGFYAAALIPYLAISAIIAMYIIRRSQGINRRIPTGAPYGMPGGSPRSTFIVKFNSLSAYFVLGVVSLMVAVFGAMRFVVYSSYPTPPPQTGNLFGGSPTATDLLGAAYILLLLIVCILGFSKIVYSSFPALRTILSERKYALMATVMSVSMAFVYLLLVNQILIEGVNTTSVYGEVPSPGNVYPFAHVFTVGIQQPFLNLVYIPYALVQLSPQFNLLIVPFEIVFTVILSLLVASIVVMAHYLISNSGLACSTKGAVLSTGGSILGLTATCPTCLVPTFVSVMFGGVVAAEAIYSNFYGVVLPPILSVATLLLSLVYLSRMIEKRTGIALRSMQSS